MLSNRTTEVIISVLKQQRTQVETSPFISVQDKEAELIDIDAALAELQAAPQYEPVPAGQYPDRHGDTVIEIDDLFGTVYLTLDDNDARVVSVLPKGWQLWRPREGSEAGT